MIPIQNTGNDVHIFRSGVHSNLYDSVLVWEVTAYGSNRLQVNLSAVEN